MTKTMVDFANATPAARLNDIEKGVPLLDYNNSPVMRQSGMQVDTKPITVSGKMLTAPVLRFGNESTEVCVCARAFVARLSVASAEATRRSVEPPTS